MRKRMKSCIVSLLMLITTINSGFSQMTFAASVSDLYVANYAVVSLTGTELSSIKPGDTCTIAVTLIDARVPIGSDASSSISSIDDINDVRIRLNAGSFSIPSDSYISYVERDDLTGYFSYTVTFNNITYLGGTPDLSFDVTYVNASNDPVGYPLATVVQKIGQASDTSIQPEVILKNSSFGGGSVAAGQNFTLNTNAYNTSTNLEIENVIATVKLPDSIVVASGSSSVVVGNVGPNGGINASFALQAKPGAEAGTAAIVVEYTYYATVQGQKQQYTSSQSISVPITQKDRFEVYDISAPEIVSMGDEAYISLGFANKGKGIIYNLSASIEGTNFTTTEKQQYIGNIAAGTENSVDFYIYPEEMGEIEGTLKLTYEDANGTETVVRVPFSITVEEGFIPEYPGIDPELPEEPTSGGGAWKWVVGLVVLAAAGAGGFWFYKKKKTQKDEAEDEDEDF